jgi:riboflavin kinase, archaea type
MKVLTGKVTSGVGNFAYWIDKLKDHYQKKTGLVLFPGTLNVQLSEEYSIPAKAIRLEGEEYGGTVSINILPCRIFEEGAVILRTDTTESGAGLHPKTLVEVACEVKLRDKYNLRDDDTVQIEIETDEGKAQ